MADWFKIYENDLDEMRLQWAIGEMPEVLNVWIVLLSEACRHKDGTLSGYSQDFELFGISKRINVNALLVNKAIELLVKISYLERTKDGGLLIRKWSEKQSEYCQKRAKENKTKTTDNVPTVSGHSPDNVVLEEKRRDEIKENNSPLRGVAILVLEHLNSQAGTGYRNADGTLQPIIDRLKSGATLEDCKLVIDSQTREWKGGDYEKYLRPETLFRAKKFEGYLGQAKRVPAVPQVTVEGGVMSAHSSWGKA